MAEKQRTASQEDFIELWKRALASQEQQWSSLFSKASESEAVAAQFGKVLETYLQMTRVSREQIEKYLQASNLPTRADIAALSKRIDTLGNRIEELAREMHRRNKKKSAPKRRRTAPPPES